MNTLKKLMDKFDTWQRRHTLAGFVVAVVRKYGDDQASYQAALLTYFGFLSLFPLLLVLTTVVQIVLKNYPHLQAQIVDSATSYFPIVGNQLQHSIQSFHQTGLALAVGLLITIYGAKGVADAFLHAVNHIWKTPQEERSNFLTSLRKSFSIVAVGGMGLILAAVIASYATAAGHAYGVRLLLIAANLIILFVVLIFIIKVALGENISIRNLWLGATVGAISIVILQSIGGYIVTHELKHLNSLYGTFAVVLGLLFWLYLQAQILVWAVEINAVRAKKLWPRPLTNADKS